VLRKILAEKFADSTAQQVQSPSAVKEEEHFLEDRRTLANPKPVLIDPAVLFVHPDVVPSKAYAETMKMLDQRLTDFPNIDHERATE
jgi:hypothetical protein